MGALSPLGLTLNPNSIRIELAKRGMLEFVQYTFPGYRTNWHHKVICDNLNDLLFGDLKRLMIFMPPRAGKSELVSRRLPAFFLGHNPDSEVILSTYAADLANRMNSSVQQIMDTREYRTLFPHVRLPGSIHDPQRRIAGARKTRTSEFFELCGYKGSLRSAGVGGGITGMGFNLGIIDDPIKDAEEGMSQVIRDKIWDWYQSTFYTRQTGFGKGNAARILLTMTRWADDDLAGRLIKLAREEPGADQWRIISIPAMSEDARFYYDPREQPDIGLWEESASLSTERLGQTRKNVASYFWNSMFQQHPPSEGGGYFKRDWFGTYTVDAQGWVRMPGRPEVHISNCQTVAAVDPAASEDQKADYTAIVVVKITPNGDGLIQDVVRERLTPNQIPQAMFDLSRRRTIDYFVFEADGMQSAIVAIARREFPNMPPIREVKHRHKKKLIRATRAIVKAENRQLWVPDGAPWRDKFFDELEAFTGDDDKHDDQVDALAYAIEQFGRNDGIELASGPQGMLKMGRATPEKIAYQPSAARRKLWGR